MRTGSAAVARPSDLEQVARQLVDPVAVLEDDDERVVAPTRARRQPTSRSSSDALRTLASKARRELGVRDVEAERPTSSSGRAGDERRIDRGERRLELSRAGVRGRVVVEVEQPPPDLAPRRSSSCSCRTPGTRRRRPRAPAPARRPDELGDQPRLAHAGLGRDADDPPVAGQRPQLEPRRRARASSAPAADERQLDTALPPGGSLQRPVQRDGPRSGPPCP